MRRRHLLTFTFAAASALLGASCLSPTLPLPPPDVESVQDAGRGQWTVSGSCIPGAVVSVFNDKQDQGVLVEDTARLGRFVVTLTADLCDSAWVSQVSGAQTSTEVPFVVEPQSPNDTGASSACH
jgi:hypothetical protein